MDRAAHLAFILFLATTFAAAQPLDPQRDRLIDAAPAEAPIPLKRVPLDILHDQKTVWTFPAKAVRGQHWKPVLGVILITAGLVALDPHTDS